MPKEQEALRSFTIVKHALRQAQIAASDIIEIVPKGTPQRIFTALLGQMILLEQFKETRRSKMPSDEKRTQEITIGNSALWISMHLPHKHDRLKNVYPKSEARIYLLESNLRVAANEFLKLIGQSGDYEEYKQKWRQLLAENFRAVETDEQFASDPFLKRSILPSSLSVPQEPV